MYLKCNGFSYGLASASGGRNRLAKIEKYNILFIINTLQHRNVDGLPATCAGSKTKNLTT